MGVKKLLLLFWCSLEFLFGLMLCEIMHNTSCLLWPWSKKRQPVSSLLRLTACWWLTCVPFDILASLLGVWKNKYWIIFISCLRGSKLQTVISLIFCISWKTHFWVFWVSFTSLPLKQIVVPITIFPSNCVRSEMKKTLRKSILVGKLPIDRSCVS